MDIWLDVWGHEKGFWGTLWSNIFIFESMCLYLYICHNISSDRHVSELDIFNYIYHIYI